MLLVCISPLLGAGLCDSDPDDPPVPPFTSILVSAQGSGDVVLLDGLDRCAGGAPPCRWTFNADIETVRLTAVPQAGHHFDHWEAPTEACVDPASRRSPVIDVPLSEGEFIEAEDRDEGYSEHWLKQCRAVFLPDPPPGGDWWAVGIDSPMPRSYAFIVYIPALVRFMFFGDQSAANPTDVVDGTMTTIEAASSKPGGERARPTMARDVVLPGLTPRTAVALADNAVMVAGRKRGTGSGAWLGRVAADGALSWQVTLGGDATDILDMASDGAGGVWALGTRTNALFVASISGTGTVSSVTSVATLAFPADIVVSGGGYAFAMGRFLNPDRESNIVVADAAGAVRWQKHVSGGFAEVNGLTALADGGLVAFGRHGATGSGSLAWIARFAADGALQWQKTYTNVTVSEVLATATGFRAFGGSMGMLVLELDANGAVLDARRFADSGTTGPSATLGFARSDGGLAIAGASAATGRMVAVVASPELAIDGCGDTSLGTDIDLGTITVADGAATITDGVIVLSSLPSYTPAPATVAPVSSTTTTADLCSN